MRFVEEGLMCVEKFEDAEKRFEKVGMRRDEDINILKEEVSELKKLLRESMRE